MKPFGLRAEQRQYEQSYYGGYCNKVREYNLEPLSYVIFQEELKRLLESELTSKKRMKVLVELTFEKQNNASNEICNCEKINWNNLRVMKIKGYSYQICNSCNGYINRKFQA